VGVCNLIYLVNYQSGSRNDMGDIVKGNFGKPAHLAKIKRSSLCQSGHHRWVVDTAKRFDVKQGKLVTLRKCSKCGKTKTSAD